MKLSKNFIMHNVYVSDGTDGTPNHWFSSMNALYEYFRIHPSELIESMYAAVGGPEVGQVATDDDPLWELKQYLQNEWVEAIPDDNYALVVTKDGIQALTDALNGGYHLQLNKIEILSDNVNELMDATTPLLPFWDVETFENDHHIVFKLFAENQEGDRKDYVAEWKNHVTFNESVTTGGLQICLKILPSDLSWDTYSASFEIQTIGLFVKDNRLNGNAEPILFGIVALPTAVYKYTDLQGFGNELTFYINTVISNLGQVLDLQVNRLDNCSLPEISSELELPTVDSAITDHYNAYVIQQFGDSTTPAIALKEFNNADNSLTWRYFSPNENSITVPSSMFDATVDDYMFVYYDTTSHTYKRADGSDPNKAAMGVRVGNAIIFAGSVSNASATTKYSITLTHDNDFETGLPSGKNYSPGDTLEIVGTELVIKVLSVSNTDEQYITSFDYSPKFSKPDMVDNINDYTFTRRESQYKIYTKSGKCGSGALFSCSTDVVTQYNWDVIDSGGTEVPLSDVINEPVYAATGTNVGKLTTVKNGSFIGWVISANSIRLGLDARIYATTSEYGVVKYATDAQVKQAPDVALVATPKQINDNYIIANDTCYCNGAVNAADNRATVSSYLTFTHSINCTGTDLDGVAFKGTAYRALWGDLAEYYRSDKYYPAGTLIIFGAGNSEITLATTECDGVISERPGFILGEKANDLDLPVALSGKVPVLFDNHCMVHCGDKVYLSREVPGKASTKENGKCIGRVIDTDTIGKTKIMCVVNINF